ncbi:MAG: tripartite tricarboxylate transporter substrate binding protein, partial [Boseongicola sp. SB0664_bin_43]|nr:tripartite tricarboxylate transporter substrate binding protein [Boseongicola sp. SB0664_bin_43]
MFGFNGLARLGAAIALSLTLIPGLVAAQDFPNGPIEFINNSKPGGGSD